VVLRISGCDSPFDAPKKSSTYAACDRTEVHEPRSTGPVVDIQAGGIEWVTDAPKGQCPTEADQIGQPWSQEARNSHEGVQQGVSRIDEIRTLGSADSKAIHCIPNLVDAFSKDLA
jgi:hypothetical protein